MSFVYDIPTKVFFGEGQIENLGAQLSVYGSRVLLVYGGGSISNRKSFCYGNLLPDIYLFCRSKPDRLRFRRYFKPPYGSLF